MTILITKELLDKLGACNTGPDFFTENNLWGKSEIELIDAMRVSGLLKEIEWWENIRKTPEFVRATGKVITMEATFAVFDPTTGQHKNNLTREEAEAEISRVAQVILSQHLPSINQIISNENGDQAWTAVPITSLDIKATI